MTNSPSIRRAGAEPASTSPSGAGAPERESGAIPWWLTLGALWVAAFGLLSLLKHGLG